LKFENRTKNEESTYTVRFGISKNPKDSIFDEIKQSLILDPLDLNVDQFENWTKKTSIIKNLSTFLDSTYQRTQPIHFLSKSN